ncbi:MAG: SAP domain-containing protein [Syntrophobacteraceae bacterium]
MKEWHVKEDRFDFIELIRSIQRSEGNQACFRKKCVCEEMSCAWRPYCLTESSGDAP